MLLHGVSDPSSRFRERLLERPVRERLDPPAVVADEVVMVLVLAAERLEAGDSVTHVDPLHEVEVGERVERPVDARDADGAAPSDDAVVDLLGGAATVLVFEEVDHGASGAAAPQARITEGRHRVL